jgi:carbon monoxide dehydrogenase subunit G
MKIDNEFTVSVPVDRAWAVLTDLEGIAPCLPGAQLTGVDGDVYTGKVKIKVGPVTAEYAGTARFVEKDEAAHHAVINATGRDSRGAGNAAAVITAALRADGPQTVVSVDTDLKITGKIAQFGSGMIKEISAKLLGQFVTSLEAKLAESTPAGQPANVGAANAVAATNGSVASESATAGASAAVSVNGNSPDNTPVAAISTPNIAAANASGSGPAADAGTSPAPVATAEPVSSGPRVIVPEQEAAPLDLMALAGGSIYKRALPLVVAVVVVVAVVIYFLVR